MCRFLLTLDTIVIFYLVYSNLCSNKLSIKYKSYTNSANIDAFEQKMLMSQTSDNSIVFTTCSYRYKHNNLIYLYILPLEIIWVGVRVFIF